MKKIAVFGKSGGGKSVFSKKLSLATDIPLFPLDLIEYSKGGEKVSKDEYLQKYHDILNTEFWIIEGFGTMETFIKRLQEADTLTYKPSNADTLLASYKAPSLKSTYQTRRLAWQKPNDTQHL